MVAKQELFDLDNKRLKSEQRVKYVKRVYENIVKDKHFYLAKIKD